MNLLLAAIKKTEQNGSKPDSLAELQLEETRNYSPPSPAPHTEFSNTTGNEHDVPPSAPSPNKISSARTAEKNLFEAKKPPSERHLHLGLIPIALIVGVTVAIAGSLYVYHQMTPPKQGILHNAMPPLPDIATHNTVSAPIIATIPESLPSAPIPGVTAPATISEDASQTANIIKTSPPPLNIRHQPEADSIDPILAGAYQAYQSGDYAAAEQRYHNALSQDPNNRDALLGLAAVAQQQGQDNAALKYYHRVLVLDPRDPVAHAALASLTPGDFDSKENDLKQLIAQQPDSAALHFAQANQYAGQSRWAEAQQAYFNALAAEPSNALFAFNLAISLDHLGQNNIAAQYYRQALQFDTTGHSGFVREHAQQRLNQLTQH